MRTVVEKYSKIANKAKPTQTRDNTPLSPELKEE